MTVYNYTVVTALGKEVRGNIEGETIEQAAAKLKAEGNILVSISEQNLMSKDINIGFLEKKPKARDLSVFCRQFVSIIDAGVPVISALEMLGEQTENRMLRGAIVETKQRIEKGESLTSAMAEHRRIFSDMFITMVEAGEASGSLSISFTRMAAQFEKEARLKAMMKKATIYPAVVASVAVVVIIGMLTFVVPTFESMFADLGTEMPLLTRMVMESSHFLVSKWYIILILVILVIFAGKTFAKSQGGKYFWGRLALKVPLFRSLIIKSESSRFARTLSTLMAAGIPLINCLDITSGMMSNIFFKEAVQDAKDEVALGTNLSEPLKEGKVFPPLVHHMIRIGEESGNTEAMLDKLADYYDEEVENATQALMAALEPLIIVVLAVIVGTIIFAVIMPMAAMYDGLDAL